MTKQHPHRSIIPPVPEGSPSPLWSVMIPTYNCADYLRETLASVLAQDPGPEVMQIEVVDDHSTQDDPESVVRELAGDRVSFYRQPQNVGYIQNFDTCLARSRGQLIHLLHGDDYILPGFYQKTQQLFSMNQDIGSAFCRHIYMDSEGHWESISPLEHRESGVLNNHLEKIISGIPIQTVSMVVKRSVYEHLGGYDQRFSCCYEDREMWIRIAAHHPVGYIPEVLAAYRLMSSESLSKTKLRSGQYAKDLVKGHSIIEKNLAIEYSGKLDRKIFFQSRKISGDYILMLAGQILEDGDIKAVFIQLKEALNCSFSASISTGILKTVLRLIRIQLNRKWAVIARSS